MMKTLCPVEMLWLTAVNPEAGEGMMNVEALEELDSGEGAGEGPYSDVRTG